jgi:hypothetical protein
VATVYLKSPPAVKVGGLFVRRWTVTDIVGIAQREADKAANRAKTPEEKYDAYREAITETFKRGLRAEEILAAGTVEQHGEPGWYHVHSQSSDRWYVVDLNTGTCPCADRQTRGFLCKHLIAAELHNVAHPDSTDAKEIALEVIGYARGRQVLNKRLSRVRVGDEPYREPKTTDFEVTLGWLRGHGYELVEMAGPDTHMGTVEITYVYRKEAP